jgi:hypothetical protein
MRAFSGAIVVSELALTFVLLAGAGLTDATPVFVSTVTISPRFRPMSR